MKTLATIFFLLISILMKAQTFEISGSISNFENKDNTISVSLFESSKAMILKINSPSSEGKFSFSEIPVGIYFIRISGNEIIDLETSKFEIINQNITLEPYKTSKKTTQLKEVVIIKKKPIIEVFADKTVFNVQNTLSNSGISAFELLRKAPSVVIDNNDNLIVEGKTGVQIYIDGKPSVLSGQDLTNYLKTVQSSDVDIIEIITNPSSKYDAAGNAGIVNIKLKKDNRFGTNGSVAVGYAIGKFGKYNSSFSLNNRTKKVNLFGTYSNQFDETYSFINLYRIQSNTTFDSKTNNISNTNANNAKIGLDYFQNQKSTFGIVLNGNFNNNFSKGETRTPITTIGNLNPSQVLTAESNSKNKTYNLQTNLNYRLVDTLGHTINADFDYGKYRNRRTNFQPNSYYNGNETILQNQFIYKMNTPIDITILSFKTDYEQNLLKGKLGLGFKSSIVNTDNTFDFYDVINTFENFNTSRSNNFKFRENINALYFNFNRKFITFDIQFGLRSETTISKGDLSSFRINQNNSVKRNYTDFFPSAGITYNPNQNNAWAINYSNRIERPSYQSLNPFEMQLDELSFSRGNPFLQPQYTNNYKISHTYKYTLNTSLSYSFIKDFFAQVTQAEGANKNFMTTKNVANQEVWNLGISYPFTVNKWWEVYTNVDFSNSSYKGNDANFVSISQNNFNFYASNTFSMPEKIKMEISGWFSSPSVWGGTYRTKGLGSLDLALQRKFWDNKMNLRLAFSDILFTSPWSGETRFGDLYISGNGGWESRQFRINLSYNFGNSNVKSTQKKTGIDDENKRI